MTRMTRLVTVLAGVATAAICTERTVDCGVREVDAFPSVEMYRAGEYAQNPLCKNAKPKVVANRQRRLCRLQEYSDSIEEEYLNDYANRSVTDLKYFNQTRRVTPSNIHEHVLSKVVAKAKGGEFANLGDFCDLNANRTEVFCAYQNEYIEKTGCQSSCFFQNSDEALEVFSKENNHGVSLDAGCIGTQDIHILSQGGITPETIPYEKTSSEANTYYSLLKAQKVLEGYAEFTFAQIQKNVFDQVAIEYDVHPIREYEFLNRDTWVSTEFIPNYKTERIVYSNEVGGVVGNSVRMPFAAILRGAEGTLEEGKVIVVLRRAATDMEARIQINNNPAYKYLPNFPGAIHDGGATYMQSVYPALQLYMEKNGEGVTEIFFTGSDVAPSAAAFGLGFLAKQMYGVKVSTVTFAHTAALGDADFSFGVASSGIKSRHIIIPLVSSPTQCMDVISCGQELNEARTGLKSGEMHSFANVRGVVTIPVDVMYPVTESFDNIVTRMNFPAIADCVSECVISAWAGCARDTSCDISNCAFV